MLICILIYLLVIPDYVKGVEKLLSLSLWLGIMIIHAHKLIVLPHHFHQPEHGNRADEEHNWSRDRGLYHRQSKKEFRGMILLTRECLSDSIQVHLRKENRKRFGNHRETEKLIGSECLRY